MRLVQSTYKTCQCPGVLIHRFDSDRPHRQWCGRLWWHITSFSSTKKWHRSRCDQVGATTLVVVIAGGAFVALVINTAVLYVAITNVYVAMEVDLGVGIIYRWVTVINTKGLVLIYLRHWRSGRIQPRIRLFCWHSSEQCQLMLCHSRQKYRRKHNWGHHEDHRRAWPSMSWVEQPVLGQELRGLIVHR